MRLATWNINGIKARHDRLVAWIDKHRPDVLCLQEIKSEDAKFPADKIKALGYHVETHGQKAYNGVALISKSPLTDITRGFGDGGDDSHARFIAGSFGDVRVASVYVPNGEAVGSAKYTFKLEWLERFRAYLVANNEKQWAIGGDYNVAPLDVDVWDPKAWRGKILCSDREREALGALIRDGNLVDSTRKLHPTDQLFTWWDYRLSGFSRNFGMRIDFFLVRPTLAEKLTSVNVDRDERGGEQPSDHAPLVVDLSDG